MKEEIKKAMNEIAKRKPGKNKLIYDKARKQIVSVSNAGEITETGLTMKDMEDT